MSFFVSFLLFLSSCKVTIDNKWLWLVKLLGYDQVGSTPEGLKRFYYALLLDFEKRVYPHLSTSSMESPIEQAASTATPGNMSPTMSLNSVPLQRTSSKVNIHFACEFLALTLLTSYSLHRKKMYQRQQESYRQMRISQVLLSCSNPYRFLQNHTPRRHLNPVSSFILPILIYLQHKMYLFLTISLLQWYRLYHYQPGRSQ